MSHKKRSFINKQVIKAVDHHFIVADSAAFVVTVPVSNVESVGLVAHSNCEIVSRKAGKLEIRVADVNRSFQLAKCGQVMHTYRVEGLKSKEV